MFASAGIGDLFLAYPVWASAPKAARLGALHEAAHLVVHLVARGEQQDRSRMGAAQVFQHRPTVLAGQHDVEHDQIGST